MIRFSRFLKIPLLLLAVLLSACAIQQPAKPKIVDHAFGFDARVDSKDTEILAFKYGIGGTPQTQAPYWKDEKDPRQSTNINGPMPLGETLYVKWRIKSTNEVFEDLVDLKPLLPADMYRQRIHFVVQGRQLFVYRIEPVSRPSDWPILGPRKFQYEKIHQIYPILNKQTIMEGGGFRLVIDAGLGSGYKDFRAIRMRTFPGPSKAASLWAGSTEDKDGKQVLTQLAAGYQKLLADGAEPCGVTTLATRAVGAPFVGCVTARLVLAERIRRQVGGNALGFVDMNLKDATRPDVG